MEWNADVIQRLRDFWTEGLSTAEIGRRLGVSKNAVVGKAHRLDLPARPSPIRRDSAEPTAERRSLSRRVEGPTLPPLASTEARVEPIVVTLVPAPVVERVVVIALTPEPAPEPIQATERPALMPAPVVRVAAIAVRPAPVPAPAPRIQSVQPRSYGRIVTCCWPIGEPGTKTFRFCDDRSEPGKPYCEDHAKLAYVKVRDRREDAA